MPVLTSLRQSPTYLYLKVYCLCALVTLFQAAPVSSRIPQLGQTLQLSKYRLIRIRLGPRIVPVDQAPSASAIEAQTSDQATQQPQQNEVVISSEDLGPYAQGSVVKKLLTRWSQHAKDLAQVKQLLKADLTDLKAYPELEWDATVRLSSALHPKELQFLRQRQQRLSSDGQDFLKKFLDLPKEEHVDPRDVPLVSLGGSGGGYRAMYGFAGFIAASKEIGLWDCISWAGGVSGSCWTLAAYYTIAYQDADRLVRHYLAVASELAHPMSVHALDTVARSSRGVYFLLGPLIRKAQAGIVGLGIMDLYATLTTTYQFLSREPRARLSRASFQFSKVWSRSGVSFGAEPLPIFTAVRVAHPDAPGVRPHTDSSLSKGQPPKRALTQHQSAASDALSSGPSSSPTSSGFDPTLPAEDGRTDVYSTPTRNGYFQWFEATPLEVGSPDVQGYIPTWAWGRPFVSGRSLDRRPEESLSLLLGQCTSAPAGPLTGYISALLASLPKGTVMSRALHFLNNFVRMKRWERRWGNPIRAGDEPNPFYGLNITPVPKASDHQVSSSRILGVGIDILHLPRIQQLFQRRQSFSQSHVDLAGLDRLARRILCQAEQAEYVQLPADKKEKYLAVRWCAKEAAYKALYPKYVVSWKHLCVLKPTSTHPTASIDGVDLSHLEETGLRTKKPALTFSNEWRGIHPTALTVPRMHLSLSHDGEYVVANVVAEDNTCSDLHNDKTDEVRLDWSNLQVRLPRSRARSEQLEDGRHLVLGRSGPHLLEKEASSSKSEASGAVSWESQGRIRLMDSGMSNNLPTHILSRRERGADIIIAFDASSDVQAGSALQRIQNFADDCNIHLKDCTHSFPLPSASNSITSTEGKQIEQKFLAKYAKVLRGDREDGSGFWLVYCPLLPYGGVQSYDPSTSTFSNSYNLVWTPKQVEAVLHCAQGNLGYARQVIKHVMLRVYQDKKTARLASQTPHTQT